MRASKFVWLTIGCVLGGCVLGCSALIEPDPGRLGGAADGSTGQPDTGTGQTDGATVDSGRDSGPPPGVDGGGDSGPPVCPASCDDGVDCTTDTCVLGRCEHTPNDTDCGPRERCNPVMGCVPERCRRDADCADGLYCNGDERCDAAAPGSGCVPGTPPSCVDAARCTRDRCDEDLDRCVFDRDDAMCADSVACTVDVCDPGATMDPSGCVRRPDDAMCPSDFCTVGRTCNPTSGCTPGMPRSCDDSNVCTNDSCSSAMGRCVNALRDDDGDTHPPTRVGGVDCGGTDCDDTNPAIRPGATEACDTRDNDCDGRIDEGCPVAGPDTCASAQEIVLAGDGSGSARGRFASFNDDYIASPICRPGMGGRDAIYYVDLPPGTWDLRIDTIGSAADTVLGVGLACNATALQAACNDDYTRPSTSTASRIWLHRVGGGGFGSTRVYILVDAYDSSVTGDFVVNVQRADARPDMCGTAAMDITGGGTVLGFQSNVTGAQRGSCQPLGDTDPEAIFFVRGPSSGTVDFDVYSIEFVPDIYLRRGGCTGGTQVACDVGMDIGMGLNHADIRVGVTTGENYYLFVDGGRVTYAVYYTPY